MARTESGSKMLLAYNILSHKQELYLRFMIHDFVPALQSMGITNVGVWQTAYGDYPARLLVFVSDDTETMDRALESDTWKEMEGKLKTFVQDYTRRVIPFDPRFQF